MRINNNAERKRIHRVTVPVAFVNKFAAKEASLVASDPTFVAMLETPDALVYVPRAADKTPVASVPPPKELAPSAAAFANTPDAKLPLAEDEDPIPKLVLPSDVARLLTPADNAY